MVFVLKRAVSTQHSDHLLASQPLQCIRLDNRQQVMFKVSI